MKPGLVTQLTPFEILQGLTRMVPYTLIALICNFFYPIELQIKEAANYEIEWVLKIIIRDLIVGLGVATIWHALIYNSSFTELMREVKFNKGYPNQNHIWREIPYSISTILIGSFFQIFALHQYSKGNF